MMDAQTAIRLQLGDLMVQVAVLSEQKQAAEAEIARLRQIVPDADQAAGFPMDHVTS